MPKNLFRSTPGLLRKNEPNTKNIGRELSRILQKTKKTSLPKSVNDKKVKNLQDFRKNYHNKKTILKLETSSKKLMVISKKDLMNDDEIIRKNFNYESSKLFKQLK